MVQETSLGKEKAKTKHLTKCAQRLRKWLSQWQQQYLGLIGLLMCFLLDKDIADLQAKLYEEMSKIEGLGD